MICLSLYAPSSYQADDTPALDEARSIQIANFRRWMVLATESELIEDIKRAADDVLSNAESINEICSLVQNGALILIKEYLSRSPRIRARLIESHRHVLHERSLFQINVGYCRSF